MEGNELDTSHQKLSDLYDEGLGETSDVAVESADGVSETGETGETGGADVVEEVVEEAAPLEEQEEPLNNAERSKLGRRVKYVEELSEKILAALEGIKNPSMYSEVIDNSVAEIDRNKPLTVDELDKALELREKRLNEGRDKYQRVYLDNAYRELGDLGEADQTEVIKVMLDKFNVAQTSDPVIDSRINVLSAKAAWLAGKLGTTKRPVKLKESVGQKAALDTKSTQRFTNKGVEVKLDEDAAAYAKARGLSEDVIKKALSR